MSAFISEVITNGFDATYLKGKKLTNQAAKQGRNLKTAMEPHDMQQVTGGYIADYLHSQLTSNFFLGLQTLFIRRGSGSPSYQKRKIAIKRCVDASAALSRHSCPTNVLEIWDTNKRIIKGKRQTTKIKMTTKSRHLSFYFHDNPKKNFKTEMGVDGEKKSSSPKSFLTRFYIEKSLDFKSRHKHNITLSHSR
jgi:hypothetical protein